MMGTGNCFGLNLAMNMYTDMVLFIRNNWMIDFSHVQDREVPKKIVQRIVMKG